MDEFENVNEQPRMQTWEHAPESPATPVEPQPVQQPVYTQSAYTQPTERPQYTQPQYTNPYAQSAYTQPVQPKAYVRPAVDTPYGQVTAQPEKKKKREKKASRFPGWMIPLCAGLVLVSCVLTGFGVSAFWQSKMQDLETDFAARFKGLQEQISAATSTDGHMEVIVEESNGLTPGQVYAANVNAVVAVSGYVTQMDIYGYSNYESFGSGFILSEDGYVVTNYHVVEGAENIRVTLYNNEVYTAELKGSDATNDIALLKIEATELPCVKIGSSDALAVGDRVAAIGNPLGELTSTLTVGYVSAKDRIVTTEGTAINMLQTDAAINSGNSGGPLFNMKGEVVGITTAKYSGTSASGATIEGIGFAIPIDDVIGMLEDLQVHGYVTGAYLGVMVRDLSESSIADGLPAGVYVEEVTEGYAAEAAGLEPGDIITELGEFRVENMTTLTRVLRKFEAGEKTQITVYRNGSYKTLDITLSEKPQQSTEEVEEEPTYLMPDDEGFEEWYEDFIKRHYGAD